MVFSAAFDDTATTVSDAVLIAVCMLVVDADSVDTTAEMAAVRFAISAERSEVVALFAATNDEFAALRDVENDTTEIARPTDSAEIAVLRVVRAVARDADAVPSWAATAATDAARTLISEARLPESSPFAEAKAVVALVSDPDTDKTDAMRVPTSADNPAAMLVSATKSDAAATLSADATDVIALSRLTISADIALEVVVATASTLTTGAKLGLLFSSSAISRNVSRLAGAFPFMADNSAFNALVAACISAATAEESPDATTVNDGNAVLNPDEMDPT